MRFCLDTFLQGNLGGIDSRIAGVPGKILGSIGQFVVLSIKRCGMSSYYAYESRRHFIFLVECALKLAILFAVVYAAVTLANHNNKNSEDAMDNKTGTIHNAHFSGGIECLSYFQPDGVRVGIGIFQPGTYDVGNTDSEEHIQVTSGSLKINGQTVSQGEFYTAPLGTHLVFEVVTPATYFCTYHK